jgi:MFS family permease
MLPMRFFASRTFSFANLSGLLMSFGMFGAIFLLAQFLQFVRFYSPLEAGAAILPWTLAPMFVAPVAGALSDRIGGGLLMGVGLTLQAIGLAWLGLVSSTTVEYSQLILPFIVSGVGMGLFFAPMANVTLSAVQPHEEGQASGASNAIRELGGVFGVAVLAAVFARQGSFASPQAFVDGLVPAVLIGAVVVAFGAVAAFAIPRARRAAAATQVDAPPHASGGEPMPVFVRVDD